MSENKLKREKPVFIENYNGDRCNEAPEMLPEKPI